MDLLHGSDVFLFEDVQRRTVTLRRVPAHLHFVLDLLQLLVQKFNLRVPFLQELLTLCDLKFKQKSIIGDLSKVSGPVKYFVILIIKNIFLINLSFNPFYIEISFHYNASFYSSLIVFFIYIVYFSKFTDCNDVIF